MNKFSCCNSPKNINLNKYNDKFFLHKLAGCKAMLNYIPIKPSMYNKANLKVNSKDIKSMKQYLSIKY